jgi:predicted AlkP superfamily phosphohydrolase/phosphomutase
VRIAEFVLRELQPDLLVMVFGESDTVCHHFWPFADPRSPRAGRGSVPDLSGVIADVYSRLDGALSRIVARAKAPALVMVVSDHGFGGAGVDALCLNRFLALNGFLQFAGRRIPSPRVSAAVRAAALLPRGAQQWLFRRARGLVSAMESRRRVGGIRWDATIAYSEELPYAPAVRINLRGREGRGVVDGGEYDRVRDEVSAALLSWRHADNGDPIVSRVWRREDLVQGPAAAHMPDLLLDLHTPGGYTYVVRPSGGHDGPVEERLDRTKLGAKGTGMGGTHRREGILVAQGAGVHPGRIAEPVEAHRVAGSVLAALGVSVPPLVGQPPDGLPRPTFRDRDDGASAQVETGDEPWEWTRMERLKGLGYLG